MTQTPEGAKRAAKTTRKRHGKEFLTARASKGGQASQVFKNLELARAAGRKGLERRWGKKTSDEQ